MVCLATAVLYCWCCSCANALFWLLRLYVVALQQALVQHLEPQSFAAVQLKAVKALQEPAPAAVQDKQTFVAPAPARAPPEEPVGMDRVTAEVLGVTCHDQSDLISRSAVPRRTPLSPSRNWSPHERPGRDRTSPGRTRPVRARFVAGSYKVTELTETETVCSGGLHAFMPQGILYYVYARRGLCYDSGLLYYILQCLLLFIKSIFLLITCLFSEELLKLMNSVKSSSTISHFRVRVKIIL